MFGFVDTCPSPRYVCLCGYLSVSPICWALWTLVRQSDMLGFVDRCLSVRYVWLCGHLSISLICWALWTLVHQSDMLGFVDTCPSVQYIGLCGHLSVSLMYVVQLVYFFLAASYTYFQTLCQESSFVRKGTKEACNVKRCRRECITRVNIIYITYFFPKLLTLS